MTKEETNKYLSRRAYVVDDQGVADEEMGQVARQQVVDAALAQLRVNLVVVHQVEVVVLGLERLVVGDEAIDRIVARLLDHEPNEHQ